MILGLHHVQITIPKGTEEEGRRFYCDVLGLDELDKPDSLKGRGGFWLRLGNQQVHVGTESEVDRSATKAHLAYQVSSLAFWRAKFNEQNIGIIDSVPISGFERFEFRDPFGNRVELIEEL